MKQNAEPVLQVRNLSVKAGDQTLIDHINFDIHPAEIFPKTLWDIWVSPVPHSGWILLQVCWSSCSPTGCIPADPMKKSENSGPRSMIALPAVSDRQ